MADNIEDNFSMTQFRIFILLFLIVLSPSAFGQNDNNALQPDLVGEWRLTKTEHERVITNRNTNPGDIARKDSSDLELLCKLPQSSAI